jgi:UTP-glucose-1-phosphate uridylyltransferase
LEPKDIIWRLLDRLAEEKRLFEECYQLVDQEKNKDLGHAILECEQLINTQMNILRRMQKRYDP